MWIIYFLGWLFKIAAPESCSCTIQFLLSVFAYYRILEAVLVGFLTTSVAFFGPIYLARCKTLPPVSLTSSWCCIQCDMKVENSEIHLAFMYYFCKVCKINTKPRMDGTDNGTCFNFMEKWFYMYMYSWLVIDCYKYFLTSFINTSMERLYSKTNFIIFSINTASLY